MKKMLALAMIGAFGLAGLPVFAADAPAATAQPNAQQQRMKDCNAKAGDKKGDERKTFMSSCLAGKDTPPEKMSQQDKMKACNAKAADKKGDERKAFMSDCLKAAPAAGTAPAAAAAPAPAPAAAATAGAAAAPKK